MTIANTSGTATITGAIGTGTNGALGNLTIGSAGAGAITLTGAIGGSGSAGAAIIAVGNADTASITMGGADYNTSGAQTFTADDYNLNGTDITFTTSADNVSFVDGGADGSIDLADAADLTISTSNGAIAIGVPILGTAGDGDDATDVTLNAGSGTLSIEDIGTDINDVLLTSSTSITLNGDITTAVDSDETGATSGVVTITGPALLLTEAILIDTDSTSNNGAVSFTSTINSATNQTLTITSGSGAVDIGGVIGGTAGDHLGLSLIHI